MAGSLKLAGRSRQIRHPGAASVAALMMRRPKLLRAFPGRIHQNNTVRMALIA
jgi:hypothetical protein